MSGDVILKLTHDEALVLFEWLGRFNESEPNDERFVDQAEQRALWNLEAVLETVLAEPFDPNYLEIIAAARDRLRDRA